MRTKTKARRLYTYDGRAQSLAAWARELKVNYRDLQIQVRAGLNKSLVPTIPLGRPPAWVVKKATAKTQPNKFNRRLAKRRQKMADMRRAGFSDVQIAKKFGYGVNGGGKIGNRGQLVVARMLRDVPRPLPLANRDEQIRDLFRHGFSSIWLAEQYEMSRINVSVIVRGISQPKQPNEIARQVVDLARAGFPHLWIAKQYGKSVGTVWRYLRQWDPDHKRVKRSELRVDPGSKKQLLRQNTILALRELGIMWSEIGHVFGISAIVAKREVGMDGRYTNNNGKSNAQAR